MKLSAIKAVYESIEAGRWIGNIPMPGFDGVRLKVRGTRNSDFQKRYAELVAALPADQREADGNPASAGDVRRNINIQCLRETVLTGWDGIDDEYTPDNVANVFADPVLGPAFVDAVFWAAGEVAKSSAASAEQDAKN